MPLRDLGLQRGAIVSVARTHRVAYVRRTSGILPTVRAVPAHLAAAKLLATIRTCPEDLGRTTESVSLGRKESSGSHSDGFDINLTFGNNHRMGRSEERRVG